MRHDVISMIFETAKLVCKRFPNKRQLAQSPEYPVTDGVDMNRRPRKLVLDSRGHAQRGGHDLRYADHFDRALTAQSHMRAHFLVRLGRLAGGERGGDNGAEGDTVAQAEVHALATGRGVYVSGIANETHAGTGRCTGFRALVFEVGEEGFRGGVARAEARRPQYVVDADSLRVLALVRGEWVRAVLLDQLLAVLY